MRKVLWCSVFAVLSLVGAQGNTTPSSSTAQALYDQGHWSEAVTAALALNSGPGYALAAKFTTMGASISPNDQKKALFEKAQGYAKKAIELDKNDGNAYFELARAQGRLAQFVGILQSLGLAKEMKGNLDQALKWQPNLASAYVALGLWNANLDAKGFVARAATGANRNQIVPNFDKALALEPEVAVHRLEFANALLLTGNKAAAKAQLEKALSLPANTFWEKRDLETAKGLLAQLK